LKGSIVKDVNLAAFVLFAGVLVLGAVEATIKDPAWLLSLTPGLCLLMWVRTRARLRR